MSTNSLETLVLEWVRQNWQYSKQSALYRKVDELIGAENSFGFVLSEETEPKGPLSTLSLEMEGDLQASAILAISGFYRHANLALRSCLALGFVSVWFHFRTRSIQQMDESRSGSAVPASQRNARVDSQRANEEN